MPDTITGGELDRDVRRELSSMTKDAATAVSKHLVMVAQLLDEEPELAYEHAQAAKRIGARAGVVREAVGLAAYRTERYAEALAELRTARRLSGTSEHLPLMADCERGLGRPERALALAASPEARTLDAAGRAELLMVAAGARQDLGQHDAAVAMLRVPELERTKPAPWLARLRSAYADALASVGRHREARAWLQRAAEVDEDDASGAADRLAEEDGITFVDLDESEDEFEDEPDANDQAPGDGKGEQHGGALE